MRLVLWLVVCAVLAIALRRRPAVTAAIALVLWALVPGVAAYLVTGKATGPLSFHPSSWLVLVAVFVQLVHHPRDVGNAVARRILVYLGLTLVVAFAVLSTMWGGSGTGMVPVIDQIFVPVLMFLLVSIGVTHHPNTANMLRGVIVYLAAVEAAYALVQWLVHSPILYGSDYLTQYWFKPDTFARWMGTTDHPLVLSFLLAAALPLLADFRPRGLQLPIICLCVGAAFVTQSRTGLVFVVLAVCYLMARGRLRFTSKALSVAGLLLVVSILAANGALSGVSDRIQNDKGSAAARGDAFGFFATQWQHYIFSGVGIPSSYDVAARGGLGTSFENSFLIYAVAFGAVTALLYFGIQLWLYLRGFVNPDRIPGVGLLGLVVLVVPQTFSALGADTLAGPLVWFSLALVSSAAKQQSAPAGTDADVLDSADAFASPWKSRLSSHA